MPFGHFSGIAGGVALAVIVIPIVVRTTEDMLRLVPNTLREAASALGVPRWLVIQLIAYRAVRAGIITGVLLAIARIAGETAPLLFTASATQLFTVDPTKPMASLPLTIYEFARSPYAEWQKLAWAGALLDHRRRAGLNIVARVVSASRERRQMSIVDERDHAHEQRERRHRAPTAIRRRRCNGQDRRSATWTSITAATQALKNVNLVAARPAGDRLHRPLRLRQVDAAARAEPDVRPLSRPARRPAR